MKLLCQNFKYLPKNTQVFELDLSCNKLGRDSINIKYLTDGLK